MKVLTILLLCATVTLGAAHAQETPVMWSAVSVPSSVSAGQKFTVRLTAKIDPGWHIYSITQGPGGPVPTEITVAGKQPFVLVGPIIGPLPHSSFDANFQIETDTYESSAQFKVPLQVAGNATSGDNAVAIDLRFQACNARQCLPAKRLQLKAPVKVARPATSPTDNSPHVRKSSTYPTEGS